MILGCNSDPGGLPTGLIAVCIGSDRDISGCPLAAGGLNGALICAATFELVSVLFVVSFYFEGPFSLRFEFCMASNVASLKR